MEGEGKGERRANERVGEGVPILRLPVPLQLAVAGDTTEYLVTPQ